MIDQVLSEADQRMKKSVGILKKEMETIRTSRATPALVENVSVEYYGVPTPLNQLATISAPEAQLLLIQPWDRQVLLAIEKQILKSDLGLTPSNDGTVIRLSIPSLNEERRRDLMRLVKRKLEDGRVAIRNLRRDTLAKLRQMEKSKQVSEDALHRGLSRLQKQTDANIDEIEQLGARKEADVMEV